VTHSLERLAEVSSALRLLGERDLRSAGAMLLQTLGYSSPKTLETGGRPGVLLDAIGIAPQRFAALGGTDRWRTLDLIVQLTGDELPALARGSVPSTEGEYRRNEIDSFVFLGLDLADETWTRRQLVGITRELNVGFAMPAIILFRHGGYATIAVIDRRENRRDASRSVVGGRVSLIKDIDLAKPHRAHVEILADLTLNQLRPAPADFRALYDAWLAVLSASALNKRFYRDLADWFAWASSEGVVQFPSGQGNGKDERAVGLIRLLTRLMFVWFIKQKDLVPGALFDKAELGRLLLEAPDAHPDGHAYYLAVLQNLFFACLNTEVTERSWLPRDATGGTSAYLIHSKFRHKAMFADPEAAMAAFDRVPFLNGGLFDCLDVEIKPDDPRAARARREGRRGLVVRVDGFSEEPERQARLPNRLFFGGQPDADMSEFYGKPTRRSAWGLIDLFERYKFTVEENTPLEEEAALDPELLGKVFENLLASYNEDTRTTARNKSGSFYTPREVVDFMVDEALVAYLAPVLAPRPSQGLRPRAAGLDFGPAAGELALDRPAPPINALPDTDDQEARLRDLLSYTATMPAFSDAEADALVAAIERCRAIDPAVGSGAFPLGLLQKLVHVLSRLDPTGARWRARNRAPLEQAEQRELDPATRTPAPAERAERLAEARAKLAAFDETFDTGAADYARKLYLIEGCLHGVDIQPIAVQIAKLRCFIALAVEQVVDHTGAKPNRGVTPLPNLEMKFVAANALGMVDSGQGQLRGQDVLAMERERRDVNAAFFSARNRRNKAAAKNRILEIREELSAALVAGGFPAPDAKALAAWDPFDANAAAPFFDPEWMFGLKPEDGSGHTGQCFDIVLANPPYVRQEKVESYRINGESANFKVKLREAYETFSGTADLYVYFYERSVRLLRPGGVIAFITSNKWYRAGYGAKLRAWLSAEMDLRAMIDFGDAEVFEAIAYPSIVVAQKKIRRQAAADPARTFRALTWTSGRAAEGFSAVFSAEAFAMPQAALLSSGWQLEARGKRELLARLRAGGRPLNAVASGRVSRGITTGFNDAFVISGTRRNELVKAHSESKEIIKPFLGGRNVKRWVVNDADRWLIKIPSSENTAHLWSGKPEAQAEIIFSKTYPSIYQWWVDEGWIEPLKNRHDKGNYFWELRSCTYWDDFEKTKIASTKISIQPTFALDSDGYYLANTSYFFPADEPLFLCAVLNSSIGAYLAKHTFVQKQGGFYEVQPAALEVMPIPDRTHEQAHLITIAVESILAGSQPRSVLESLINAFVYELFLPEDFAALSLSPFADACNAGLPALAGHTGSALKRAAEEWSRVITDPSSSLFATLFALQSIDSVRIIEGRT